jgi:hypothetical protein
VVPTAPAAVSVMSASRSAHAATAKIIAMAAIELAARLLEVMVTLLSAGPC